MSRFFYALNAVGLVWLIGLFSETNRMFTLSCFGSHRPIFPAGRRVMNKFSRRI